MISNDRCFESRKFVTTNICNTFEKCSFFYPFLRQSLYSFLSSNLFTSVLLPSYVPEGIIDPFKRLNFKIYFYEIDENGYIDRNIFKVKTGVFVYIHYFGVYNANNIEIINENINADTLFIEDFAHTIMTESTKYSGGICTFSFTKMIGVPEGACIFFNKILPSNNVYYSKRLDSIRLFLSMYCHLAISSYFINQYASRLFNAGLYLIGLKDYYKILMRTYSVNLVHIRKSTFRYLCKIDFEKISRQRKEYANLYFTMLNPTLLYNWPKEYYIEQALFAFPIKVTERDEFVRKMKKCSIGSFYLTHCWWFNDFGNTQFCNNHLLLPISHKLDTKDIIKVINVVNGLCLN